MSNAKYAPAPTRDSFEDQSYTQAPPSYQAEASTSAALLSGVPRGEDDNVPDDFKVSRAVDGCIREQMKLSEHVAIRRE